jgi:hypothetical protein
MMLPLNDALWKKLDDAHRDRDIPELLSEIADTWNEETVNSLLFDCLCHQETCYGATYAAIPHLLNIAQPERNRHQRREIALFAGFVALCALEDRRRQGRNGALPGLLETFEEWDGKLDCFRGLVASLENPDRIGSAYERSVLLPRWKRVLTVAPVNADDLAKVQAIKAQFVASLSLIKAVCERALLENLRDEHAVRYLLSGAAAAGGLLSVARLLNYGAEGLLQCASCHWTHEYILFENRIAVYAREGTPSVVRGEDAGEARMLRDFKDGLPSRCDGFISPARDDEVLEPCAAELLALAERAPNRSSALLLRNFLGVFVCCKCGAQGPTRAG